MLLAQIYRGGIDRVASSDEVILKLWNCYCLCPEMLVIEVIG